MVTVKVTVPAGPTIEEAIQDCLEFSGNCKCAVSVDLNGIWMHIVDHEAFGNTVKERVKHYADEFHRRLEERMRSHEERWNQ